MPPHPKLRTAQLPQPHSFLPRFGRFAGLTGRSGASLVAGLERAENCAARGRTKVFASTSISSTRAGRRARARLLEACGAGTILPAIEYTRIVRIVPGSDTFSHPDADARQPLRRERGPAALHLPARADALVSVVPGHAGARSRSAVLRRAGAPLPRGADRACPTGRATTNRPTCTWSSTGSKWRPPPSSSAGARAFAWPTRSAPTAGSTAPC